MATNKKSFPVAVMILKQLGGKKFLAMTGCHQLGATDQMLGMKLRRNQSPANYLRITLNSMDLYDMEFLSIRQASCKVKESFENVCFDQLQLIFTQVTGFDTHL